MAQHAQRMRMLKDLLLLAVTSLVQQGGSPLYSCQREEACLISKGAIVEPVLIVDREEGHMQCHELSSVPLAQRPVSINSSSAHIANHLTAQEPAAIHLDLYCQRAAGM